MSCGGFPCCDFIEHENDFYPPCFLGTFFLSFFADGKQRLRTYTPPTKFTPPPFPAENKICRERPPPSELPGPPFVLAEWGVMGPSPRRFLKGRGLEIFLWPNLRVLVETHSCVRAADHPP